MAILQDASPDGLVLGSSDPGVWGHQVQPPVSFYQSSVPKGQWGGGTWSEADFLTVVNAPWGGGARAWMLTSYPAPGWGQRERSELLEQGQRGDLTSHMWQTYHHWTEDPSDPANFKTIYYSTRRVFGDSQVPWSGPKGGGVVVQVKGAGYDDPNVAGTSETMNFQQGPIFELLARGSNFEADVQGGILTMTFGTTGQDYVSGRRNAWGYVAGALVSGHVYDIVVELTLSLGGQITVKNQPLPASPLGGVRVWLRDYTLDQTDWNDAAHLLFDSFSQASHGDTFTPDYIPAAIGPRAVGSIETWNYKGETGETYPGTGVPVAAAALTNGYLPFHQFAGRGLYLGGAVNGETNAHRTYVGKERICTTKAEAFALYGSGSVATGSAPAATAPPTITGTAAIGNTLTWHTATWTGSPTPTITKRWQATFDGVTVFDLGVTASTLVLDASHVGLLVRVTETAGNTVQTGVESPSAWTAAVAGTAGNWIGNPGAETTPIGMGPNIGSETISRDSTFFDTGAESWKVVTRGGLTYEGIFGPFFNSLGQAVWTPAGTRRTASFRLWIPNGVSLRVEINSFTATGVVTSPVTVTGTGAWQTVNVVASKLAADSWQQLAVSTGPGGNQLGSITFWLDNVTLVDAATPTTTPVLASSASWHNTGTTAQQTFTKQFDVAAGLTNAVMEVIFGYDQAARPAKTVTYGGVALTLVKKGAPTVGGNVEVWRLIAPPSLTAGTANLVVDHGSGNTVQEVGEILLYTGVDQTSPESASAFSSAASSKTPSVTVVSNTAEVMVAGIAYSDNGATVLTPNAGQTDRVNYRQYGGSPTPFGIVGAVATKPGATSDTIGWAVSGTNGNSYTVVGVSLKGVPIPAPASTSPPTIVGSTIIGQTVTGTDGGWTLSPSQFSYQWFRQTAPGSTTYEQVPGNAGIGNRYVPTAADYGLRLMFQVIAYNQGVASLAAQSAPSAPVDYPAPVNQAQPTIFGAPVIGGTLTADTGGWANVPTDYRFQWLNDDGKGGPFTVITGAVLQTFSIDVTLNDCNLVCDVTAINSSGRTTQRSTVAGPIYDPNATQTFNQPDADPIAGNFSGPIQSTATTLRVHNNRLQGPASGGVGQTYDTTFVAADMVVRAMIMDLPGTSGRGYAIHGRIQHPGHPTLAADYLGAYIVGVGFQIYLFTGGGNFAQLGSTDTSHVMVVGELLELDVTGSTITLSWVGTDGIAHQVVQVTDSTIAGNGTWGLEINDAVASLDNARAVATVFDANVSDTGAGVDSGSVPTARIPATDFGNGTDSAQILAVPAKGIDAGTGANTGSVAARVAGTDSGHGTDTAAAPRVRLTGSLDTAAGADSAALTRAQLASRDTGGGIDSAFVTVKVTGSDHGTVNDSVLFRHAVLVGSDSGSGADSATPRVRVTGTDSGHGIDTTGGASVGVTGTDRGSGRELASTGALLPAATDSGRGVDTVIAYPPQFKVGTDRGGAVDFGHRTHPAIFDPSPAGQIAETELGDVHLEEART